MIITFLQTQQRRGCGRFLSSILFPHNKNARLIKRSERRWLDEWKACALPPAHTSNHVALSEVAQVAAGREGAGEVKEEDGGGGVAAGEEDGGGEARGGGGEGGGAGEGVLLEPLPLATAEPAVDGRGAERVGEQRRGEVEGMGSKSRDAREWLRQD